MLDVTVLWDAQRLVKLLVEEHRGDDVRPSGLWQDGKLVLLEDGWQVVLMVELRHEARLADSLYLVRRDAKEAVLFHAL